MAWVLHELWLNQQAERHEVPRATLNRPLPHEQTGPCRGNLPNCNEPPATWVVF